MSAGRPLAFDPDDALRAAVEVFWAQGYEATSLQDLLGAMALSKSSLYQTFGSKHALFDRCVEQYCDSLVRQMRGGLERAPSALAFITETFRAVVAGSECASQRRGCLLLNTASEFGQRDRAVAELVAVGIGRCSAVFCEAIERAQAEGAIAREREPRALADYLVSSMSGLRTMVKAGLPPERLQAVVENIVRGLS